MNKTFLIMLLLFGIGVTGCKKYLDARSKDSLAVPTKLEDLQAILDNVIITNEKDPCAAEMSCDNYYLTEVDWNGLSEDEQRLYVWAPDYIFPRWPNQWGYAYDVAFLANTVLDNLQKIEKTNDNANEWDHLKGQALFHRARIFSQVAFIWAPAYDPSTADNDLGIPLRLTSDFNQVSARATMKETYDQIVKDLKGACQLLPVQPYHVLRPSKAAAYGMLSRIYLSMREYNQARQYADSALAINNTLLDYNDLNPALARPITRFNPEVVFDSYAGAYPSLNMVRAKIDSHLYVMFENDDLRKTVFFNSNNNGTYGFKGTYSGGNPLFTGIANDEIYLNRAECLAREGKVLEALNDLNTLLRTRWRRGTFVDITAPDAEQALDIILQERRKELIYRNLRWIDIKRLNKEGKTIVLKRDIGGTIHTILPNDLRYALAIPEDVIALSGIVQNPR